MSKALIVNGRAAVSRGRAVTDANQAPCCCGGGGWYHAVRCPTLPGEVPDSPPDIYIPTTGLNCQTGNCPIPGAQLVGIGGRCYELEPGDLPMPPGCQHPADKPLRARIYDTLPDGATTAATAFCYPPDRTCLTGECAQPGPCCVEWDQPSEAPCGPDACRCGAEFICSHTGTIQYDATSSRPQDIPLVVKSYSVQCVYAVRYNCRTGRAWLSFASSDRAETFGGIVTTRQASLPNLATIPQRTFVCGTLAPMFRPRAITLSANLLDNDATCTGNIETDDYRRTWRKAWTCSGGISRLEESGRTLDGQGAIVFSYSGSLSHAWAYTTTLRCPDGFAPGGGGRPGLEGKPARPMDPQMLALVRKTLGGCVGCGDSPIGV